MKIAFCGDVVGRPGRSMLKRYVEKVKKEHAIDLFIVNYENASHGFGLSEKNAKELLKLPIDVMTGGNHTWDKKEIINLMDTSPILRPINYPEEAPGRGLLVLELEGVKVAVINLMGYFTMPMVDNPFTKIEQIVSKLEHEGIKHIFIDFHAEATAEKRALLLMLKGRVSAICGSHTHIGTDDLVIDSGTSYVTDAGLIGCRDNALGMEQEEVLKKCLIGVANKFEVTNKCKKIFQCIVTELDSEGRAIDAYKLKAFDEGELEVTQRAYVEQ